MNSAENGLPNFSFDLVQGCDLHMILAHEAGSGIEPGLTVSHMNMRDESNLYSELCC